MKRGFLHALAWVMAIGFAFESNAQIGVTKFGTNALASNSASGEYNTGLGYYALGANTSGNRNTGSGANALRFNTTGIYNTATGAAALYQNTTGNYNSAFGAYALFTNTTGSYNTAFGNETLRLNTTGSSNTATGYYSLSKNTTGTNNTANGLRSLYYNTTGNSNTASGFNSLGGNSTGANNTAMGQTALSRNGSGSDNTSIGSRAMYKKETGSRNTALGSTADVWTGNLTNATAIGYSAVVSGSNRVRIGNVNVTSIGGQVGWTTFSDGRYKKDIQESVPGLAFINSLRPVTYTVNVKGLNEYYEKATRSADKAVKAETDKSEGAAAKIVYNGFVAQEVELAAKKLDFQFSGVDVPETKDGLYGLRYDNFISPMVKAMQELSEENGKKDSLINDLQSQINDLKALITRSGSGGSVFSTAYIKQNAPNPFRGNTVISYYIPDDARNAQIRITDVNGRVIKTFNATKGEGQIVIRSGELSAGTYSYTLFVNNKRVDNKQMVLLGNSK